MSTPLSIQLPESAIPTAWYNLNADFPEPMAPYLHPATREPVTPDDLAPLFPSGLIEQEFSRERYIEIPEPIRDVLKLFRPSPLHRAARFEKAIGTGCRIYYKYEGASPAGSHKVNTSLAQAYYNKVDGVRRLTTETGAGQWGAALSFACAVYDLECEVWQVRASYDSKPYRAILMNVYGGTVHSSPSTLTQAGRDVLAKDPDTPGSLGIAVSEAIEAAMAQPNSKYSLGSVLNHVMLHQSIIGLETRAALESVGERADIIVGCAGGGSNLAGLAFPFVGANLTAGESTRIIAAEPKACPSLTAGTFTYDHGDIAGLTPLMKMYTLGKDFIPDPIHAGGLRYHGMSPMVSHAVSLGLIEAVAVDQSETFTAGMTFARTEGIVPAPESTHAIAEAMRQAQLADDEGERKVIVIGLSGHGLLDLPAYASSRPRVPANQPADLRFRAGIGKSAG